MFTPVKGPPSPPFSHSTGSAPSVAEVKTWDNLALASVKTVKGLALVSVKLINGRTAH